MKDWTFSGISFQLKQSCFFVVALSFILGLLLIAPLFYLSQSLREKQIPKPLQVNIQEWKPITIPDGYLIESQLLLSADGTQAILGLKANDSETKLAVWQFGSDLNFIPLPQGKLQPRSLAIDSKAQTSAFFIEKAGAKGGRLSLYLWDEGLPVEELLEDYFLGRWKLQLSPNGNRLFVLPEANDSIYGQNPDQKSNHALMIDLIRNDFTLDSRSVSSRFNISIHSIPNFSSHKIDGNSNGRTFIPSVGMVSSPFEPVTQSRIELAKVSLNSNKQPFDLNRDLIDDLITFERAEGSPIWKAYTLDGWDSLKLGAAPRPGLEFIWRLGFSGGTPIIGDFNGDGLMDLGTFSSERTPNGSNWAIFFATRNNLDSSHFEIDANQHAMSSYRELLWGITWDNNDIAVPGDFDGDSATDIGVFNKKNGLWLVLLAAGNFNQAKASLGYPGFGISKHWGTEGDVPVLADYNGDGCDDFAVVRKGKLVNEIQQLDWWISFSPCHGKVSKGERILTFGELGDTPIPGDYNGDGKDELAVYRSRQNKWLIREDKETIKEYNFGTLGAEPFISDFNGDGKHDLGLYFDWGTQHFELFNQNTPEKLMKIFQFQPPIVSRIFWGNNQAKPVQVWLRKHQNS